VRQCARSPSVLILFKNQRRKSRPCLNDKRDSTCTFPDRARDPRRRTGTPLSSGLPRPLSNRFVSVMTRHFRCAADPPSAMEPYPPPAEITACAGREGQRVLANQHAGSLKEKLLAALPRGHQNSGALIPETKTQGPRGDRERASEWARRRSVSAAIDGMCLAALPLPAFTAPRPEADRVGRDHGPAPRSGAVPEEAPVEEEASNPHRLPIMNDQLPRSSTGFLRDQPF